jgi:Fe-S-cluster containining protein
MSSPKCTDSECDDCGAICCSYQLVTFPNDRPDVKRYYEQRAEKVEYFDKQNDLAWLFQPCPLLDLETKRCTDYENRNEVCREFPPSKKPIWIKVCPLMIRQYGHLKKGSGQFRALKI